MDPVVWVMCANSGREVCLMVERLGTGKQSRGTSGGCSENADALTEHQGECGEVPAAGIAA